MLIPDFIGRVDCMQLLQQAYLKISTANKCKAEENFFLVFFATFLLLRTFAAQ